MNHGEQAFKLCMSKKGNVLVHTQKKLMLKVYILCLLALQCLLQVPLPLADFQHAGIQPQTLPTLLWYSDSELTLSKDDF